MANSACKTVYFEKPGLQTEKIEDTFAALKDDGMDFLIGL